MVRFHTKTLSHHAAFRYVNHVRRVWGCHHLGSCGAMDRQKYKLQQIASIANAEPIGSWLFFAHLGLLFIGAVLAAGLFDNLHFAIAFSIYATLITIEKYVASVATLDSDADKYPVVVGLLLARALTYNAMVYLVWITPGDLFKFAALALLVAATINIMVFHATYRVLMICVVGPIWLGFSSIALNIAFAAGWGPQAIGAVATVFCITPYFLLSLAKAHTRWNQFEQTKSALSRAQRLEAMGKVAGGVSHDFNNILSVVSGSLQLLEEEDDPAERKRLLNLAHRSVANGAALNKQLLALGKKSTLMPEAVNLRDALDECQALASAFLHESVSVEIIPTHPAPWVFVDPHILQTALLNLVLNAKNAMPKGGKLTIGCGPATDIALADAELSSNGGYFAVVITDNGLGMPPEVLAQVFDPFFTTGEVGGGTGLGLPMVKGFAEQSKGGVLISSKEGHGTTVTVILPRIEAPAHAPAPPAPAMAPTKAPLRGAKVLVVEDNVPLLKIIARHLQSHGMQVLTCENGDSAARLFDSDHDISLVLSDMVMPGRIQGADLLNHIRAANRTTPVVLMSGYAHARGTLDDNPIAQADLFMDKPLNLKVLSSEILRLV